MWCDLCSPDLPMCAQVLGWLQPYLTDQFIKLAFHPQTFETNPDLIELERGRSNENPPYMFRCTQLPSVAPLAT